MRRYLLLLVALSGCDFYFGEDDPPPPPPCKDYYDEPAEALELRNPQTGECEYYGTGGPCQPDRCGPCYAELGALPDWGSCTSQCTGLDEASCLSAPGCNASYDLFVGIPEELKDGSAYTGCWATAPSGPVQGESCFNLDSQECSRHDDCSMFFDAGGQFTQCLPEPSNQGCALIDCAPGYRCEEQCTPCAPDDELCDPYCAPTCVPDGGDLCDTTQCEPGTECITVCTDALGTDAGVVPGECYATCVDTGSDPGSCTGDVLCDAIGPACPAGTVAGIKNGCYSGYCIPQAACGPSDPGGCEPAQCESEGPACPAGTVGGTKNGCWTGYCIPVSSCPQAQCENLTDEQACTSRFDCRAIYAGDDCTCDAGGCTCSDLTFARCESQLMSI